MSFYETIDTTSVVYTGPLVLSYPLHEYGVLAHVVADQEYYIRPGSYVAPARASTITIPLVPPVTAHLVGDSTPALEQGGVVRFSRQWANTPTTWYDYESYVATFPGIFGQRASFQRAVTARIEHAYFLCLPGQIHATPDLIATIAATGYSYPGDALPRPPDSFFLMDTTTPTQATYANSVAMGGYTIVVEPSTIERYMGDVWLRKTKRIKPL